MWMLIVLLIIAASADDRGWAYPLRLQLGPLYLNVFLLALILTTIVVVITNLGHRERREIQYKHPLIHVVFLYIAGLCSGVFGTFVRDSSFLLVREVGFAVRDYLIMPWAILLGYYAVKSIKSAAWFAKGFILAGVAVSICQMIFFRTASAEFTSNTNINELRTNAFDIDYASVTAVVLCFLFLVRNELISRAKMIAAILICLLGTFITLHRSAWLSAAMVFLSLLMHAPRSRRILVLKWLFILIPIGLVTIFLSINLASRFTHSDFAAKMEKRITTMMPGSETETKQKAWDTRLPGISRELELWSGSPVWGRGFGIQEQLSLGGERNPAFHHNAYTDILAKSGIIGILPYLITIFGIIVIGRRLVLQAETRLDGIIGAFALGVGFLSLYGGMMSWTFNGLRTGLMLGLTTGAIIKYREIRLTEILENQYLQELRDNQIPYLAT